MRASLIAAGARQFAKRGVRTVSVEELIAEADISRATFYGMFSSKYNLLDDILNPVFDNVIASIRALAGRPPDAVIDGIVDVYLDLWATSRDALLLIPTLDEDTYRHFERRHKSLNEALLEALGRAERADLLRNGSAQYSLKVIARTAVPLLRVYDGHPAAAALVRDALHGLLLRARP
jgi:AcrR family transcriptional regulator